MSIKRVYVIMVPQNLQPSSNNMKHCGAIAINSGSNHVHYYDTLEEAETAQRELCDGRFATPQYTIGVLAWEDE